MTRKPDETNSLTFPAEALVGSLGKLATALASGTEVPEQFIFACGLTVLGAMCSGELTINLGVEVDPRFYTVLLGSSYDVKKSTALKKTIAFFESLASKRMPHVMSGVGSAEGLARNLSHRRNVLLAYDELRSFVDKTKVQTSVLLPLCASLYEQHRWENATKNSDQDVRVEDGRLSLLGCCTTDTYEQMWTKEAISIGFPNRLFVIGADRKCKVAWPQPPHPDLLVSIRTQLLQQVARLPLSLEASEQARNEWETLYLEMPSGEHVKRLDTLGFRLLALIALITDKEAIDLETVATVRLILDYELMMRQLTDPIDADNVIAKLEEKIRRVLTHKGPMKGRDLKKAVNAHRAGLWAFDRAVQNLTAAQEVKPRPTGELEIMPSLIAVKPSAKCKSACFMNLPLLVPLRI